MFNSDFEIIKIIVGVSILSPPEWNRTEKYHLKRESCSKCQCVYSHEHSKENSPFEAERVSTTMRTFIECISSKKPFVYKLPTLRSDITHHFFSFYVEIT